MSPLKDEPPREWVMGRCRALGKVHPRLSYGERVALAYFHWNTLDDMRERGDEDREAVELAHIDRLASDLAALDAVQAPAVAPAPERAADERVEP